MDLAPYGFDKYIGFIVKTRVFRSYFECLLKEIVTSFKEEKNKIKIIVVLKKVKHKLIFLSESSSFSQIFLIFTWLSLWKLIDFQMEVF